MKNGRFEIGFGGFFAGMGLFVTILCIMVRDKPGAESVWIGILVGLIFTVVGGLFIYTGVRSAVKAHRIIKAGKHYPAVIVGHDADTTGYVNGQPLLMLVVRYFDDQDRIREEQLKTGQTSRKAFPIGGMVEVAELSGEDEVCLVSKKALQQQVPRQAELLDPAAQVQNALGMSIAGSMMTASAVTPGGAMQVACPSCGTVSSILPGTTLLCPCGRKFTLTADHMIV
ncbi:MAG: hypothetical protein IK115_12645 [Lachnospiraceae bacterium]|nr:hypothetical protein [Lachnospiraceae bacterium]